MSLPLSGMSTEREWSVEGCSAVYHISDGKILTDGRIEDDRLMLRLYAPQSMPSVPRIQINNDMYQVIDVEGEGKVFSFSIDYYPYAVAKLLKETSVFLFSFDTQDAGEVRMSVKTNLLPVAVNQIQEAGCIK